MNLTIDLPLVEEVVFLGLRECEIHGETELYAELRRRLDSLYELPVDSIERDNAFRDFNLDAFDRFGHDRWLRKLLREFRLLTRSVDRMSLFKAVRQREEGGELYVRDGARTAVLRVRPVSFLDLPEFSDWLRREILHVQDMVDPEFGYRPDLHEDPSNPARYNLLRERYAILWQASIDARLGLETKPSSLSRVFRSLNAIDRRALLSVVREMRQPTHDDLLALARGARPAALRR